MNRIASITPTALRRTAIASAVLLLAACAAGPVKDPGADRVRADLSALQSDPNLANRAPVAMQAAEEAVRSAEIADTNAKLTAHRVYIADRKVQTTKALAQEQYDIDQRSALSKQHDQVRLDARTHEADAANRKNDALLQQLADLNAKKTPQGIELTLGDVLFSSGRAELAAGSASNLDKLVTALKSDPTQNVEIDGHTDSQGSDEMNMSLSQRRADSVSLYLSGHGVDSSRLTATGKGEGYPVAGNETATGRQLNRRVVVTLTDSAM